MKNSILLALLLIFASCKSNQNKKDLNQEVDCSTYNDKYVEFVMNNSKDSALYYIDKAIICNPNDEFYKTEKVKLLLKFKDYEQATEFAKLQFHYEDPTKIMLYGALLIKQGDPEALNVLKKAEVLLVEQTSVYNKNNSNLHLFRIGLNNYFQGKDSSFELIQKFRNEYSKEHEVKLADYIEDLIKNQSKENVLFELLGIDDN